jgi:hypothetical protein
MTTRLDALKRRFGPEELLDLATAEGLHHRGSGRRRCECPGCRNGDVRGVSIGEKDGCGVWHCFRPERHGGTAIDFLMLARGLSLPEAAAELEKRCGAGVVPIVPRPIQPLARPPSAEVRDLWARCRPLSSVSEVAATWAARGLDVEAITRRDLARALPLGLEVPRWAWGAGRSWSTGPYRLIVPMVGADGRLASLHARVARAAKQKGLSPCGYAIGGTLMSDATARRMLSGNASDLVLRNGVLVVEGVPDFLEWATKWKDGPANAPAVLGVIAGSWTLDTPEIASRIPEGIRVGVATHHDPPGEKYASAIARTIGPRCTVLRLRLPEAA